MKIIKEFIDKDGYIISGDEPYSIDSRTTAKTTTDKHIGMVAQPFMFTNYRRYYGESELPYNEIADKYKDNPEKFYKFLKDKNQEEQFTNYFVKHDDPKSKLKELSYNKAIEVIEALFDTKMGNDEIIEKDLDITIDEIKYNDEYIFEKLDKICDYINDNYDKKHKKIILNYINGKF